MSHIQCQTIGGNLCDPIDSIIDVFLCSPVRNIDDQSTSLRYHELSSKVAGDKMSTNPSIKHGVPSPKGLLPKRITPSILTIFYDPLIAIPHVVDQNI